MGVKYPTPASDIQLLRHDPFKTARLNQAGRKNKLRHSCGVTATLATKNHKALIQPFATKKSRALKPSPEFANSGSPVPVARSRGPVPARSRCPVPVPVARSRWPGPGGPVPVARSRWPGPGPALRARARGPARKKTYSAEGGNKRRRQPPQLANCHRMDSQSTSSQRSRRPRAGQIPAG